MSTVELPLVKGGVALVDEGDFSRLAERKWYRLKAGRLTYAFTTDPSRKNRQVLLHRAVLQLQPGDSWVDHINRDGLDNRRANLRLATPSENARNQRKKRNGKLPYRGIARRGDRWFALCAADGTRHYLGIFDTAEQAGSAYDIAATRLHGAFASLNGLTLPVTSPQLTEFLRRVA